MSERGTQCVTVKELAEILNISVSSIWRYSKSGKIPAPVKVGGSTRWLRDEIDDFLRGEVS